MRFLTTIMLTGAALMPATAMADCRSMGGTANIRNMSPTEFVVAMSGDFEGGAFARSLAVPEEANGWITYQLEHYFTADDGSWIRTRDVGRHRQVEGDRHYGETTYRVVDSGGDFAGLRGEMRSWGAFDYGRGDGVLRFEGELCPAGE